MEYLEKYLDVDEIYFYAFYYEILSRIEADNLKVLRVSFF